MRAGSDSGRKVHPYWLFALLLGMAAFDGFDLQAMAFVSPSLAREWKVELADFGFIFSVGLSGLVLGGMLLAPLGDRFGRRRLILSSGLLIVAATCATAFTNSMFEIAATRFLTSLGLGSMMPALVSIAFEAAPPQRRGVYVATLMCGFPMGAFIGGMFSAWYLPRYGWPGLFVGMSVLGALILTALCAAIENDVKPPRQKASSRSRLELFERAPVYMTIITWLLFFVTLLNVYLLASWLPSLLERGGFSASRSAFAASIVNFGGMVGGPLLALMIARFGERSLALTYVGGAVCVGALGLATGSFLQVAALCFLAGVALAGGQACNSAIAAARYPSVIRATGIGWALSIGRLGAVLGPMIVAIGLQHNLSNQVIFMIAGGFGLVSAAALIILTYQPTPSD